MCPLSSLALTQVEIIRSFTAKQPDELSLQVADVVLIYQRVSDGECKRSQGGPAFRVWGTKEAAFCYSCAHSTSLRFFSCAPASLLSTLDGS